jgi:alcohol dehydrogenase (cytochrome c)
LDPGKILTPPTDSWPTYNGDYTGRRFSPLTQINKTNVGAMSLAWAFQAHTQGLQSMPLEVNGILYIAGGNQAWAVDARTGRQVWHFARPGESVSGGN